MTYIARRMREDWSYLRAHGMAWRAMLPIIGWVMGVLVVFSMVGCTTTQQAPCGEGMDVQVPCVGCQEWVDVQTHIKQAEAYMPGYWVRYSTEGTTPEQEAMYAYHKRWIEARDAIHKAKVEGRDE